MANTTNFGWETPDDTDLVKDGALAMRTLGNAIDTSLVDLKGGTTGQVLSKNTNTDMDFTWVTPQTGDITEVTAGTGLSGGGTSGAVTLTNTVATTFDAKADLVVGTGADTFAKLSVGSNGDSIYAASAETTGLRYNPPVGSLANAVINGGFDVWQRGTSFSSPNAVYVADRWKAEGSTPACTISRQATGDTTNIPNIQYGLRFQRNSGQTNTTAVYLYTGVETANAIPFAGKTVTISFYAKAGANYSSASSALSYFMNTGTGTDENPTGSYTGNASVASGSVTLTTSYQRFAFTATIGATATEFKIGFFFTPSGTAGANDWYEVTGVQIDVGTWTASTAPTFRRSGATLAGELAACQRYYFLAVDGTTKNFNLATYFSATTLVGQFYFPVTMRSAPTLVATSGTDYYSTEINSVQDLFNSLTILRAHTNGSGWFNNTEVAGTAGQASQVYTWNASASIAFNSEL